MNLFFIKNCVAFDMRKNSRFKCDLDLSLFLTVMNWSFKLLKAQKLSRSLFYLTLRFFHQKTFSFFFLFFYFYVIKVSLMAKFLLLEKEEPLKKLIFPENLRQLTWRTFLFILHDLKTCSFFVQNLKARIFMGKLRNYEREIWRFYRYTDKIFTDKSKPRLDFSITNAIITP